MATSNFVTIDSVRYKILDRQPVRYPYAESAQEREARGEGPVPEVAYTSCKIERIHQGDEHA